MLWLGLARHGPTPTLNPNKYRYTLHVRIRIGSELSISLRKQGMIIFNTNIQYSLEANLGMMRTREMTNGSCSPTGH